MLRGLAPSLQGSGVPVAAPPPSVLSSVLGGLGGVLGIGGQQAPTPPQMLQATANLGAGNGAPPPTMGGAAAQGQPASGGPIANSMMGMFGNAVAGIESAGSGGYGAVGPQTKSGDQALGRYQVMASNVGPWTKQVLGQELTPQQFLASPQAQDAVFNGVFGNYLQQTGNPRDAASMWFTGKPYAQGASEQDQLGTTGAGYVQRFMAALPGGGGSSGGGQGGLPAGAMAYAPGGGSADTTPMPQATASGPMPPQSAVQAASNMAGSAQGAGTAAQGGTPVSASQVLGPLLASTGAGGAGGQAWQMYRQAAANGGAQGGLTLPPGMTPQALAQMISTPETMQMGLGIWQRSLYPQVQAFKPGDYLVRGTQPMGQVPSPLQHVEAGRDDYGQPTYGAFNPQTGATTPDARSGATAPGAAPAAVDGPNPALPSGPDFLKTLPTGLQAQVQAYAEGRMKLPTGNSANSPIAQRLRQFVLQYDPTFDATNTDARFDTRKNFTSGAAAQSINSGNTAVQHGADLSDAAEALGNGQYPLINKLKQAYGNETGGNIPGKEFAGALNDFADEVVRFYRNSGGTESDIAAVRSALDPSQSPDQLRAGIAQQVRLIAGKTSAFQNQWHQGMGPLANDFPIFSPETQAALARINARPPSTSAYPPSAAGAAGGGNSPTSLPTASPAGSIPTLTDPSQLQALPPGTRFRTPDGQLRVRH